MINDIFLTDSFDGIGSDSKEFDEIKIVSDVGLEICIETEEQSFEKDVTFDLELPIADKTNEKSFLNEINVKPSKKVNDKTKCSKLCSNVSKRDSNRPPMKGKCTIKYSAVKKQTRQGLKSYELHRLLGNNFLEFLQENGLVAKSVTCYCGKQMRLAKERHYYWRCNKNEIHQQNHKFSFRRGTWFENSNLSIQDILWIAYMWVYDYSYLSMFHECNHGTETLSDWMKHSRDICQAIMEHKSEPLGGTDKSVKVLACQLDEANVRWVFLAHEQLSSKTLLIVVPDKENVTILDIFTKYILPGSRVVSNICNLFINLCQKNFDYFTTDMSITFYDNVTNTDIKNFNQMQRIIKKFQLRSGKNKYVYSTKLSEEIYRMAISQTDDAYLTFLKDISKVCKPVSSFCRPT